jgi:hypothetical protein
MDETIIDESTTSTNSMGNVINLDNNTGVTCTYEPSGHI